MSRVLQYPARCEKCGYLIPAGTSADFYQDGGKYRYLHVEGGCEAAQAAGEPKPKRSATENYISFQCSKNECSNAVGVSFKRSALAGRTPPERCFRCGEPWAWTSDEDWLAEEATA